MTETTSLFVYGTLRDETVQHALFRHVPTSTPDTVAGYRRIMVPLSEPGEPAINYPMLIPDADAAPVPGDILELSTIELAMADEYEGEDYARISVETCGGRKVWVYVKPQE